MGSSWTRSKRRRLGVSPYRKHSLGVETLEPRTVLSSGGVAVAAESPDLPLVTALEVEPQYEVNQTPRLQPGNAPLVGTPAYLGTDQIDILWQTRTVGTGTTDQFTVRYRLASPNQPWQTVPLNQPLDTGVQTRVIHSATILGLEWDTTYEYQVQHRRAGELLSQYERTFRTRLEPGDAKPFRFVAYGDSASLGVDVTGFREEVQPRINQVDPDFAVLLGDNIYLSGSHREADARFDPDVNPAATEWIGGHVDYFAIGNHEGILGTEKGQPSRDSFSVPVPVAGVNAPAEPPAEEYPENNFSFDYGNTHFVSIDTNPAELPGGQVGKVRIDNLLEYVVADLQASNAQWKIVYTHHPIIGTAKGYDGPEGTYFQQMLPRLREAGVDLIITSDSHTYSWTQPLIGFEDRNQDGIISADEVDYVDDPDRVYDKGAGLVQVVSGVGGRSLRSDAYGDPFIASAYSSNDATGPIENGFAQIDVTADRLTVTYISAKSGQIVGDTNGNGIADPTEPFFGRFQLVDATVERGDLNSDGLLNADDIDLICAALLANDTDARFDMNGDGVNDQADHAMMIDSVVGTVRGDANLDGVFDSNDLIKVFQAGKYEIPTADPAKWVEGDWNCDGQFSSADLVLVFQRGDYRG